MDFGMLPPEINSVRMYGGPGSRSMVAAAAAWDGLAAELRCTAASYTSVVSGLTTAWRGHSSAMMAAATMPYAAWLVTTAAQAEQTALQARAAAGAYETAFAATVPPPLVAANRSQLASLVATNLFGQNTAAIAATEAQYADMWASDAAAMYGYAGQSAAASKVIPFNPAPQSTDPAATANQAAAVSQAMATSTGTNAQSTLSHAMSAVPQSLQSLAAPAAVNPSADPPSPLGVFNFLRTLAMFPVEGYEAVGKGIVPANDALISTITGLVIGARGLNDIAAGVEPEIFAALPSGPLAAGLNSGSGALASAGSAMSAGVGRAGLLGALSVPPAWAVATPTVRLAATMLQGASAAAAPAVIAASTGGLFGQMGMASLAGGALGAALPRAVSVTAIQGNGRGAGKDDDGKDKDSKKNRTPEKLKRVLAEMSQDPESLQHWYTDKDHLESLLDQLSNKPGFHAVHLSKSDMQKPTPPTAQWG